MSPGRTSKTKTWQGFSPGHLIKRARSFVVVRLCFTLTVESNEWGRTTSDKCLLQHIPGKVKNFIFFSNSGVLVIAPSKFHQSPLYSENVLVREFFWSDFSKSGFQCFTLLGDWNNFQFCICPYIDFKRLIFKIRFEIEVFLIRSLKEYFGRWKPPQKRHPRTILQFLKIIGQIVFSK